MVAYFENLTSRAYDNLGRFISVTDVYCLEYHTKGYTLDKWINYRNYQNNGKLLNMQNNQKGSHNGIY